MKKIITLLSIALGLAVTVSAQGDFGPAYIQSCTPGNTAATSTTLDTSLLQSSAGANLIVTHVNESSIYTSNDFRNTVGVRSSAGIYSIYDENGATMPDSNLFFAVLNPTVTPNGTSFVQTASASTDSGGYNSHYSMINNPATNNNPAAVIFITHNGDLSTVNDTTLTSVYYSAADGEWALYKENASDTFPAGDAYNVFVPDASSLAFTFNTIETSSAITFINNPALNGNDSAIVLVTHQNVAGFPNNNHPIGVWYDASFGEWTIYNEDQAYIPTGSAFNVLVANSFAAGIANIANDPSIKVYPVPASSSLSVETAAGMNISTATLTDMSGRALIEQSGNNANKMSMDVAGISTGMYLLRLDTDHSSYTRKVSVSQ